jgi:hypothetical protein
VAEIEAQRRGPTIWPWIIGLVVLALLVWALAELLGTRGQPSLPAEQPVNPSGALLTVPGLTSS